MKFVYQLCYSLLLVVGSVPGLVFCQEYELRSNFQFDASGTKEVWYYFDEYSQREFALVGNEGLKIIDISNPDIPVLAAHVPDVAFFDIKVWDKRVYTVTGGAQSLGHIIDISDPFHPEVVGSFYSAHNIWITEAGVMYTAYDGLGIYNLVDDPLAYNRLKLIGENGHDVIQKDNYLFDFHGSDGTYIYDVESPLSPVLFGQISDVTIAYHHSGWVTDDLSTLYICDELAKGDFADITIWDISDISNPEKIGEYKDPTATVHNLFIVDEVAYVSYYSAGLRVFDISDRSKLKEIYHYDTNPNAQEGYTGAFGVFPYTKSGLVLVSDVDSGLFIFSQVGKVENEQKELMLYQVGSETLRMEYKTALVTHLNIELIDMKGAIVLHTAYDDFGTYLRADIPVNKCTKGVYIARFTTVFGSESRKIILY